MEGAACHISFCAVTFGQEVGCWDTLRATLIQKKTSHSAKMLAAGGLEALAGQETLPVSWGPDGGGSDSVASTGPAPEGRARRASGPACYGQFHREGSHPLFLSRVVKYVRRLAERPLPEPKPGEK